MDEDIKIIDLILKLKDKCKINEERIRNNTPLSPAEYSTILEIEDDEEISATELSQRIKLSPSRSSRIIDSLVEGGYLMRNRLPDDRRQVGIRLSEKGIRVRNEIMRLREECEKRIIDNFSEEDIERVKEMLSNLIKIL